MSDIKTVQALVEPTVTLPRRIVQGALEAISYGDKAAWVMNLECVKEELESALIAQMQRDAVQPAPEPQQDQLQQPDGNSVAGVGAGSYDACTQHDLAHPCEECAAESVSAKLESALAECRDLFPIPKPGEPAETEWLEAMSYPPSVPAFIRASLAATTRRSAAGAQKQDDHAGSPAPSLTEIEKFDAYMRRNYPDAKGDGVFARAINTLETMDTQLGMQSAHPAESAVERAHGITDSAKGGA